MDTERGPLTPHRRQHWAVEPEPPAPPDPSVDARRTPEESRREAKRLLWRDSAIILVGVLLALLLVNYLPSIAPAFVADQTDSPPGGGTGASLPPGSSLPPGATLGPVVDPGLGIDATPRPVPGVTLPPTGTAKPVEPGATATPSPRPTKKPAATLAPTAPPPTPAPTPVESVEVTAEPPTATPEPPSTDEPTPGP
jgi:hypothetical protein